MSCCTPPRDGSFKPLQFDAKSAEDQSDIEAINVPGGSVNVGTKAPQIPDDGEGPLRSLTIKPFRIAVTTVTNEAFQTFVNATGYLTEAERFGWSFVFWSQVPQSVGPTQAVNEIEWWRRVDGACWFAPNGPNTEDACIPDHPVVHIS